jgi:hypothetical protein
MLTRLIKEIALVAALTALLLSLAATVGLQGRTAPEQAEASNTNVPATSPPDFVGRPW